MHSCDGCSGRLSGESPESEARLCRRDARSATQRRQEVCFGDEEADGAASSNGLQANDCRAVDDPNRRWSLNFLSNALTDCRRFRILLACWHHGAQTSFVLRAGWNSPPAVIARERLEFFWGQQIR